MTEGGDGGGGYKTVTQSRGGCKSQVVVTGAAERRRLEASEADKDADRSGRRGAGKAGTEGRDDPCAAS